LSPSNQLFYNQSFSVFIIKTYSPIYVKIICKGKNKNMKNKLQERFIHKRIIRFTLVILLILVNFVPIYAQSTSVQLKKDIKVSNLTVLQLVDKLGKDFKYSFFIVDEQIGKTIISVDLKNATINEILDAAFIGKDIFYIVKGKNITISLKKNPTKPESLKKNIYRKITGIVTDENNQGIIGANVLLNGTKSSTITDVDGKFSIEIELNNNTQLRISYIGYEPQTVDVSGKSTVAISLRQSLKALNEVVVVGYGTQKKETVTGAIGSVGNKELMQASVENVGNALVGRIAGLTAIQQSGEPGNNAATLRIRGVSTFSGSQDPLVVIDGIQQTLEVMNSMDSNEIEGINILKDASATAVYGVRGANGVIIVTTKRGKAGKPQISFSSNYGITMVTSLPQLTNSYDYALFRNQAIKNDGDPAYNKYLFTDDELWKFKNNQDYTPQELANMNLSAAQIAKIQSQGAIYYTSHDWYKEQFGNTAPQNQYNLNISGGNEKVKYFTSVGYFSQDGLINNASYGGADVNSTYNRYNFRSNIDVNFLKNWDVSVNTSAEFSDNQGILGSGNASDMGSRYKQMNISILESSPFASPGFVDGKLITGLLYNPSISTLNTSGNSPMALVLNTSVGRYYTSIVSGSIKLKHTLDYLTKGLTVHALVSYDDRFTKGVVIQNSIPCYSVGRSPSDPSQLVFSGGVVGANAIYDNWGNYKERKFYVETAVNYNRTFGKSTVTGLFLANAQKYSNPGLQYNVPQGLMGFSSRATYNYDERYLVEFNLGYNGSENFPVNNRFGLFPALSGGWVVSNEPFFPKDAFISWLKIRASYGEVGNDQIGGRRFMYLPSTWGNIGYDVLAGYSFGSSNGSSPNAGYTGVTETTVGNPLVTWERARKQNYALEIKFFKDKLSVTGDYFYEKRDNILWTLGTTTNLIGATLPPANIGKMTNQGFELQVEWRDRIESLNYWIKGNLTFSRNKVDFMDEPKNLYPWMNSTLFSYGQYKGYKTSGFYNTQEEVNNHPYSTVKVQLGDIKYVDINGDGIIDSKDVVPIGYSALPQYAFNLSMGLEYKGFDISILCIGTANGSFPITYYFIGPFLKQTSTAYQWQFDGQWTAAKAASGQSITYPRASMDNIGNNNGAASDFWLKSNDFFRIKNIEIGYTFKKLNFLSSLQISQIRIYSNANNLWTWSKDMVPGIDPEATGGLLYPLTRIVNFGVKVQF
jgi:TonB-linked SusC/RagA family outer membrane protein